MAQDSDRADLFGGIALGAAALAALWTVSGLAVFVGPKVMGRFPERSIRIAGTVALTGFGIYSLIQAFAS